MIITSLSTRGHRAPGSKLHLQIMDTQEKPWMGKLLFFHVIIEVSFGHLMSNLVLSCLFGYQPFGR